MDSEGINNAHPLDGNSAGTAESGRRFKDKGDELELPQIGEDDLRARLECCKYIYGGVFAQILLRSFTISSSLFPSIFHSSAIQYRPKSSCYLESHVGGNGKLNMKSASLR